MGSRYETWKTLVHWGLPTLAALGTLRIRSEWEWDNSLEDKRLHAEMRHPSQQAANCQTCEATPDQLSNPRTAQLTLRILSYIKWSLFKPLSFKVIYYAAKANWHRDKRLGGPLNDNCSSPDKTSRGLS